MACIGGGYTQIAKQVYNIPSKVEPTAKLLGVKGSSAVREKIADDLSSQFSKMMEDLFFEKDKAGLRQIITKGELRGFFRKLAPNVDIQLMPIKTEGYAGCIRPLSSGYKNAIRSYEMELPFESGDMADFISKNNSDTLDTINHEARHFFNYITEPKSIASLRPTKLSDFNHENGRDFYKKTLYADEVNVLGGLDSKNAQMHVIEDKKARADSVKNKIKDYFDSNFLFPKEEIDLLRSWRYALKGEAAAFKEEHLNGTSKGIQLYDTILELMHGKNSAYEFTDLSGKVKSFDTTKYDSMDEKCREVKKALDEYGQYRYSELVEQQLFIPQKIKVVEKMLADKIAQVRAKQKSIYEKFN